MWEKMPKKFSCEGSRHIWSQGRVFERRETLKHACVQTQTGRDWRWGQKQWSTRGREGGRESRSPGEGLTLVRVTSEGGAEIWRLEAEAFLSECFYFLNKKLRSWMGVGAAGQRRFMEREKTWNGYLRKVRKCLKTPGRNHRSVSWWPWVR